MLARLKLAREKEEDCMESLVDLGEAEETDEDDEEDESSEVSSRYGGSSKEFSSPSEAPLVPGDCLHSTPFRAEVPPPLWQGELTGPSYGVQEGPTGPRLGARDPPGGEIRRGIYKETARWQIISDKELVCES